MDVSLCTCKGILLHPFSLILSIIISLSVHIKVNYKRVERISFVLFSLLVESLEKFKTWRLFCVEWNKGIPVKISLISLGRKMIGYPVRNPPFSTLFVLDRSLRGLDYTRVPIHDHLYYGTFLFMFYRGSVLSVLVCFMSLFTFFMSRFVGRSSFCPIISEIMIVGRD